jgi:hypothetical protein
MTDTKYTHRPTLALDFDGVVHRYSKGWEGGDIYDPPTDGFFEWLIEAQEHFTVIIHSSRCKDQGAVAKMAKWLAHHAEMWRGKTERPLMLNVGFSIKKPAAFLTIDDRALTFEGDWASLPPADLVKFKPWNQRP